MRETGSGTGEPEVLVIVVNWNGREVLGDFLERTLSSTHRNLRITVVDNASSDVSASIAAGRQRVRLVQLEENKGWGSAVNAGLADAAHREPDYYLFMNNDVFLDPEAVKSLVNCIEEHPDFGLLSPVLLDCEGDVAHSGGRFTNLGWWARQVVQPDPRSGKITEMDLVIGAAMFAKAELVERIGGFDPEFFLYREDVDYSTRARRAGFRIGVCRRSRAVHIEGATTRKPEADGPRDFDSETVYKESFAKYAFKHLSTLDLVRWLLTGRGLSSLPYVLRNISLLLRIRRRRLERIEP